MAIYAQGANATFRWRISGPAALAHPQIAAAAWEQRLAAGLAALGAQLQQGAQAAYADVRRVRDGFVYDSQALPFPRVRLLIEEDRPFFHLLERFTRPHLIVARRKPYLRFYWQKEGRWFTGMQVRHPGTPGRHALDAMLAAAEAQFVALLDAAAQAVADA